jgi:hypothetical protein
VYSVATQSQAGTKSFKKDSINPSKLSSQRENYEVNCQVLRYTAALSYSNWVRICVQTFLWMLHWGSCCCLFNRSVNRFLACFWVTETSLYLDTRISVWDVTCMYLKGSVYFVASRKNVLGYWNRSTVCIYDSSHSTTCSYSSLQL